MDKLDNFMKVEWGFTPGDPEVRATAEAHASDASECVMGLAIMSRAVYDDMVRDNAPELVRKAILESIKNVLELEDGDIKKEGITIHIPPKKK